MGKMIGLALVALLATGCSVHTGGDFCKVSSAWTGPKAEAKTVGTLPYTSRFIVKHNSFGSARCGWKTR